MHSTDQPSFEGMSDLCNEPCSPPLGSGLAGQPGFFDVAPTELAEKVVRFGVHLMVSGNVRARDWMRAFTDQIDEDQVVEHLSEIYSEVRRRFNDGDTAMRNSVGAEAHVRATTNREPQGIREMQLQLKLRELNMSMTDDQILARVSRYQRQVGEMVESGVPLDAAQEVALAEMLDLE